MPAFAAGHPTAAHAAGEEEFLGTSLFLVNLKECPRGFSPRHFFFRILSSELCADFRSSMLSS